MASKEDLILTTVRDINGHIMSIKEDIGGIKQHLKDLNSKVASHEQKLNKQDGDISELRGTLYKMIGGLSGIVIIIQILI